MRVAFAEITNRGGDGIASYALFPSMAQQQHESAARERAKEGGISGIVVMQFKGIERTTTRKPNPNNLWRDDPYFRRPWGARSRGWNSVWEPTTVRTNVSVQVETRVYSLEQDTLLWAPNSGTMNPSGSNDVIRDLSAAVAKILESSGELEP